MGGLAQSPKSPWITTSWGHVYSLQAVLLLERVKTLK